MTNTSQSAQDLPHFSTESPTTLVNPDVWSPCQEQKPLAGSGRVRGGNVQVRGGGSAYDLSIVYL